MLYATDHQRIYQAQTSPNRERSRTPMLTEQRDSRNEHSDVFYYVGSSRGRVEAKAKIQPTVNLFSIISKFEALDALNSAWENTSDNHILHEIHRTLASTVRPGTRTQNWGNSLEQTRAIRDQNEDDLPWRNKDRLRRESKAVAIPTPHSLQRTRTLDQARISTSRFGQRATTSHSFNRQPANARNTTTGQYRNVSSHRLSVKDMVYMFDGASAFKLSQPAHASAKTTPRPSWYKHDIPKGSLPKIDLSPIQKMTPSKVNGFRTAISPFPTPFHASWNLQVKPSLNHSSPFKDTPSTMGPTQGRSGPIPTHRSKQTPSPLRGRTIERTPGRSGRPQHPPVSKRGQLSSARRPDISPTPQRYVHAQVALAQDLGESDDGCFLDSQNPEHMGSRTYQLAAPSRNQHKRSGLHEVRNRTQKSNSHSPLRTNDVTHSQPVSVVARMMDFWETATTARPESPDIVVSKSEMETGKATSRIETNIANASTRNAATFRTHSSISPKTLFGQSREMIHKNVPQHSSSTAAWNLRHISENYLRAKPVTSNRDKDGPSNSMSPFLRPLSANVSLTAIRSSSLKTPSLTTTIMMERKPFTIPATPELLQACPTSQGIQHIYAEVDLQLQKMEVQSIDKALRAKKRRIFLEKWNLKLPGPILETSHSFEEQDISEIKSDDEGDGETETERMVVKEAECNLAEPKPLRLTEVKSIRLLCRGRTGLFVYENVKKKQN